jgi:two-component system cell cycle response regulator CpdR
VGEPDEPAPSADIPRGIEHDLINSLASIVGFSQVIRRDPSLPEELRRSADLLVEEATRTRRMVHELLEVLRQRPIEPGPAPIGDADAQRDPETLSTSGAASSPGATATSGARPRVLVLEDETSMRAYLEKALTLLGYEPVITSLAAEAVELATAGDHAALLFDHQMPGMSGMDAFEAVFAARPDLAPRAVMMSGDVSDPDLEPSTAHHAVTVLAKPFDLDTLDATIRAVMEATGQSRG